MRTVIIGNSASAVGVVETLREHDQRAEIVMVSEEPHMIYSRPLLDHYLAGKIGRPRLAYRSADFHQRHNVTPLFETRIERLDTAAHEAIATDGRRIGYDKLVICTGGLPIFPPIPGREAQGVYTFTRLDDVDGINARIEQQQVTDAVVVGGGMIGIKATDALTRRGVHVTMLELAPRILSAALDEAASGIMAERLRRAGVSVLTGNTLSAINSTGGQVTGVTLQDGNEVPAQLVVFGIGVRPNTTLVQGSDIVVNRGIVVDRQMRTSNPDVYAAGDVAEAYDLVVDLNRTVAIWPNAYRQGGIAGADIAGLLSHDRGGVAMNAIEVDGLPAMAIGSSNAEGGDYEVFAELDPERLRYKRLVLQGGRLVGAILVGQINRAGIYTGLIRTRMDVSDYRKQLLSESFGLLSLPEHYRKHIVTGQGIEV
ncbi:MAG: FAD-dependent oxidoreductase [Anaerolineales bacterium]